MSHNPFSYCKHINAIHCNTLHHNRTHCNTLQRTATHCNARQHTATHCNTLQHTATHCNEPATHCNILQHTTTHCNTLQHTATVLFLPHQFAFDVTHKHFLIFLQSTHKKIKVLLLVEAFVEYISNI